MGQSLIPFLGAGMAGFQHGMSGGGGKQGGKGGRGGGMLPQLMQQIMQQGGSPMQAPGQGGGMPQGGPSTSSGQARPGMMQPMQGGGPVPASNSMYNPQSGQFTGQKGTDWLKQQGKQSPTPLTGMGGPVAGPSGKPPGPGQGGQPAQMLKPPQQKKPAPQPQGGLPPLGQGRSAAPGGSPSTPPNQGQSPKPQASAGGDGGHAAFIQGLASKMGIDPDIALKVARSEGLGAKGPGDKGSSFGDFQLHYGGMAPGGNRGAGLGDEFTKQTGLSAKDPSTWRQQDQFALEQAKKGGWGPFHGAARSGIGNRQGLGSGMKKTEVDHQQIWNQASEAIQQGAPHDKVMQRMQELMSA